MANQMGDASGGRPSGKGKPLNSIEHKTSKPTKAWIKKELAQQQKRFKQIFQNLEDLTPKRNKRYADFLEPVSTCGTNIDGYNRAVVAKENVPNPHRRKHKVTYEAKDLKGFEH